MHSEEIDRDDAEWAEANTLFGGYLHQDFDAVHGDGWSAVRAYASESTQDERSTSAESLRRLLTIDDAAALKKALDHFGMSYYPPGDGYSSYRSWLGAVADHLEDPEAHPGPPDRDAPSPTGEEGGGRVSTFADEATAERAVSENLEGNRVAIEAWRRGAGRRGAGPNQAFEWEHGHVVGRLARPATTPETIHDVDRSRVILRRTTQAAEGWFVMVAYPVGAVDPAVARSVDRAAPAWDALWTLFGGYLHQDFDIHGGVAGAMAAFVDEATVEQVADAAAAARRLLAAGGGEGHLATATEWLGMDYHPPGDGLSYREWLTTVAILLEHPDTRDDAERAR